jgi:hypothetical protein
MATPAPLDEGALTAYIHATIPDFHAARLASLGRLRLRDLIRSKNPYLFRAKNILLASDLVEGFLRAHLSSQEETIFGTFLERLAIFVAGQVWGGRKSAVEGIDLEFNKQGILHLVTIKSGPDWGNASQVQKMKDYFAKAARTLRTNTAAPTPIFINGCCYGRSANEAKDGYYKLCGQSFWEYLSGDSELYRRLIVPIGHQAQQRNDEFAAEFAKVVNQFTRQLLDDFCDPAGAIDWARLLAFNSGHPSPKTKPEF